MIHISLLKQLTIARTNLNFLILWKIYFQWFISDYYISTKTFFCQIKKKNIIIKYIEFEKKKIYYFDEITKSKINKRRNDFVIKIKKCLIYKIIWTNDENENIISQWWIYDNFDKILYAIVDFHHKHSNAKNFHFSFVRSNDWKSLTNWN